MEITSEKKELTLEEIWAIFRESAESSKRIDRILEETAQALEETAQSQKETARRQKENERLIQKNQRMIKENNRLVGNLSNRIGEMVECLVKPDLQKKFRKLGYVFNKVYHDTSIKDEKNNIQAQVDLTLENGDKVMLVEVKTKPTIGDINDHIERIEKVRLYSSMRGDTRKFLGAVAGMVIHDSERNYALKTGFYVLEPSGETFKIIAPPGPAHEW